MQLPEDNNRIGTHPICQAMIVMANFFPVFNSICLYRLGLENQREIEVPTETSEKVKENLDVLSRSKSVGDEMKTKENLNDEIHSKRRTRRQAQRTNSLLDSVSQECDGITLRWLRPNIPFR